MGDTGWGSAVILNHLHEVPAACSIEHTPHRFILAMWHLSPTAGTRAWAPPILVGGLLPGLTLPALAWFKVTAFFSREFLDSAPWILFIRALQPVCSSHSSAWHISPLATGRRKKITILVCISANFSWPPWWLHDWFSFLLFYPLWNQRVHRKKKKKHFPP